MCFTEVKVNTYAKRKSKKKWHFFYLLEQNNTITCFFDSFTIIFASNLIHILNDTIKYTINHY
jgi:Uri superfamily endonuclease